MLSFAYKHFDGVVPELGDPSSSFPRPSRDRQGRAWTTRTGRSWKRPRPALRPSASCTTPASSRPLLQFPSLNYARYRRDRPGRGAGTGPRGQR
jgi:hypothetical protein